MIEKAFNIIHKILTVLYIPLIVWIGLIWTDVAVIKGNRFTATDAYKLQEHLLQQVNRVSENINLKLEKISQQLKQDIPPDWFKERVDEQQDTLKKLMVMLNSWEGRLTRIETKLDGR